MNQILTKIKEIMIENINKYLPEVIESDLEGNGTIYYMNGNNGTEFDWYVNGKISDFMAFYSDKDNKGAIKTTLYNKGDLIIYIYGEKGKTIVKEIKSYIEVPEKEILSLATLLKNEADEKKIWDEDIEKINTDLKMSNKQLEVFIANEHYYVDMRERKVLLGKIAYVSGKIVDEGWKVGYMYREEAEEENESGWTFMAGNEDDEYVSDFHNIRIMSINSVIQLDSDVWKHINDPVGTRLIRISSEEFEEDQNNKAIYTEKNR